MRFAKIGAPTRCIGSTSRLRARKAHEFYSEALEVRRDPGGELGLYFRKTWPRGKRLGTERIHHAIATRFSRHDGHSVAERPDGTSLYGRPVKFVGFRRQVVAIYARRTFGAHTYWWVTWAAPYDQVGRADHWQPEDFFWDPEASAYSQVWLSFERVFRVTLGDVNLLPETISRGVLEFPFAAYGHTPTPEIWRVAISVHQFARRSGPAPRGYTN